MADKFLNLTAVQTIKTWADGKYALDTDLDALDAKVDDIIAEGGEPNVIEVVKVNGTALTPVQKAVDVIVPTATSDLTNDGDGTSNFATEDYVDENGGKIDSISIDGTTQTIDANKNVALDLSDYAKGTDIPTATSDLTNDSDFQTSTEVQSAIDTALTSAMEYKGTVATVADLPSTGNKKGDFWNVTATGENYAWDGNAWDLCGNIVDASVLWTSQTGQNNTLEAATVAEINAILNA